MTLHTTIVSIKGSRIETIPCSIDFSVLEDACAIGDDPCPASFEHKPLATPYFKPTKNKTNREPDFYLHETDQWLVFPHELDGLTIDEIKKNKPEMEDLIDKISPIIK